MTDTLSHVVVPYAYFLERRDRRRRIIGELQQRDALRTVDAEAVAVAVPRPRSDEQEHRYEGPHRLDKVDG
jgi:hypothetical protein